MSFVLELLNKVPSLSQVNTVAMFNFVATFVQHCAFHLKDLFWPVFFLLCFLFHNIVWMLQCSRSCERGVRTREAFCLNNLGRHLPDRECQELPRVVTQSCNEFLCPSWSASEWSEVMNYVKFKTPLGLITNIKIIWTVFFVLIILEHMKVKILQL